MANGKVYLNGEFLDPERARISPMDRGFLFADGVYEVIPAFNGVLFRLDAHLQRLERSLAEVSIANPHDRAGWRRLCEEMVAANGGGNLSVYLQITRGVADKRDHAFPDPPVAPTVFLTSAPIPVPAAEAFRQVGAGRFLAHGVQLLLAQHRFDALDLAVGGHPHADPVRFALAGRADFIDQRNGADLVGAA